MRGSMHSLHSRPTRTRMSISATDRFEPTVNHPDPNTGYSRQFNQHSRLMRGSMRSLHSRPTRKAGIFYRYPYLAVFNLAIKNFLVSKTQWGGEIQYWFERFLESISMRQFQRIDFLNNPVPSKHFWQKPLRRDRVFALFQSSSKYWNLVKIFLRQTLKCSWMLTNALKSFSSITVTWL